MTGGSSSCRRDDEHPHEQPRWLALKGSYERWAGGAVNGDRGEVSLGARTARAPKALPARDVRHSRMTPNSALTCESRGLAHSSFPDHDRSNLPVHAVQRAE